MFPNGKFELRKETIIKFKNNLYKILYYRKYFQQKITEYKNFNFQERHQQAIDFIEKQISQLKYAFHLFLEKKHGRLPQDFQGNFNL